MPSIQDMAREMAEKLPAVALATCPGHEGHEQECYIRGHSDGMEAGIELVYQMLCGGKFDNFFEFYEHWTEGQGST